MPLQLITAPSAEPLSLEEVKLHLRVDSPDEDSRLQGLIRVAREHVETLTGRQLMIASYVLWLDEFPSESGSGQASLEAQQLSTAVIRLPRAPLQAFGTVKYLDLNNILQTMSASAYRVDTMSEPGRLTLMPNQSWPDTYAVTLAVQIAFSAGYSGASNVPEELKQAMYLLIGHWHENREATLVGPISKAIEMAVESLCWAHRILEWS